MTVQTANTVCVFCDHACLPLKCSMDSCESNYHEECLGAFKKHQDEVYASMETLDRKSKRPKVVKKPICLLHYCKTCFKLSKDDKFKCDRCLFRYHKHCVPPNATLLEKGLLCNEHPIPLSNMSLKDPLKVPFTSRVFVYGTVPFQIPLERTPFDPSDYLGLINTTLKKLKPKEVNSDEEQSTKPNFLSSKAATNFSKFKKIVCNNYTLASPVKVSIEDSHACNCKPSENCGKFCLNRITFTECLPKLCPCGDKCTNQRFQRREYAPLKVVETSNRGHGCVSTKDLKEGDLIIEYVGEVIDKQEYANRMQSLRERGEGNFYFLALNSDRIIDAASKGGIGRFINHSCDPNCQTERWTVGKHVRVGIFAIKDIPAGEELNYNYHMRGFWSENAHPCHCGADICSGDLSGKVKRKSHSSVKSVNLVKKGK